MVIMGIYWPLWIISAWMYVCAVHVKISRSAAMVHEKAARHDVGSSCLAAI